MREIKFRVWDKEDKIFVSNGFNMLVRVGESLSVNERFDFQQFTGLKDKNGVEIYEGDIIKYKTCYYGRLREDNKTVIEWQNDLEHDGFGEPLAMGYIFKGYDYEVIGNVHQNPELMKEKV